MDQLEYLAAMIGAFCVGYTVCSYIARVSREAYLLALALPVLAASYFAFRFNCDSISAFLKSYFGFDYACGSADFYGYGVGWWLGLGAIPLVVGSLTAITWLREFDPIHAGWLGRGISPR